MIPLNALKALLEGTVRPGEPALTAPPEAHGATLDQLRQAALGEVAHVHVSTWNKRPVLNVAVEIPVEAGLSAYRYRVDLRAAFTGDVLHVWGGYVHREEDAVPLAGEAQLRRAVAAVREKLSEAHRREQKREKIRKLKVRAVEAQVAALAARMRFAFALEPMTSKVKLVVQLDAQNGLFVDIPFTRAHETIAGLDTLIETVRDLYGRGLRFKVASCAGVRGFRRPGPA